MSLSDIAGGMNASIQQQLEKRLQAQAVARQIAQQQFQNQLQVAEFQDRAQGRQNIENDKQAALLEKQQAAPAIAQGRLLTQGHTLGEAIPADTKIPEGAPSLEPLQAVGLASMDPMQAEAPPPMLAAAGDSGKPADVPGTMPNSPMPAGPRLYTKLASAGQANTAADNARQDTRNAQIQKHELAMEKAAGQRAAGGSGPAGGFSSDDADSIAGAIISGEQPPVLTGLYGKGAAVRAKLAKQGYNLASATLDWQATSKFMATANGTQQMRMHQAVDNATHSLDVIEDLAGQWKGGKFPILNRAGLAAAKAGLSGPEAQRIATQLEAQISDVTSELGNVYMGGNSPTDHALGLAKQNLSADWTEAQLKSALNLARKNLQIRQNSMIHGTPSGASAANPYFQGQGGGPPVVTPAAGGGGNAKTAPAADPMGIR